MADDGTTTPVKDKTVTPGKTFNFSLTGDPFHSYETLKEIYEDAANADEEKVTEALAALDPDVRVLVEGKFAKSAGRKELSQREVFARAVEDAIAHRDSLFDEAEAEGGES